MGNNMGNYITISVACKCYNVTRKTIYNWRAKGLVEEKKDGRSVLLSEKSIEAIITPKLPQSVTQTNNDLTAEIARLHTKIDNLEKLITQLLPNQSSKVTPVTSRKTGKFTPKEANAKRQEEAINKARTKFIELGCPDISRAELARQAGVDRNTVGKHWAVITRLDLPLGKND